MTAGASLTRRQALAAGAAGAAALALPPAAANAARKRLPSRVDVAIIGGGFSGLAAARDLRRRGASVVVLEARDRVGGRTLATKLPDGTLVDDGGQWIGPGQNRLASLAKAVGAKTFKSYDEGQYVFLSGEDRMLFRDLLPPLPEADRNEFLSKLVELEAMEKKVPVRDPRKGPGALAQDKMSVEQWKLQNLKTDGGRYLVDLVAGSVFSTDPKELSFLHWLFYASAAGEGKGDGFIKLTSTAGGAQESRFEGGSQSVAIKVAQALGDAVRLSSPTRRIERHGRGVKVVTSRGSVIARRAIVAMSPLMAGRIAYEPALPALHKSLLRSMPNGNVIKIHAVYPTPFWRADGLAGYALTNREPVKLMYDNSPSDGSVGILMAFIEGSSAKVWAKRPAAERRAAVVDIFTRAVGPQAASPSQYHEKDWTADPWTRGCYGGHFEPGGWTRFGGVLRAPAGPIHFAGTETATEWMGYIDGAVQSGLRAAAEVAAKL